MIDWVDQPSVYAVYLVRSWNRTVAHGDVVTSSRQITEVKQRWVRLVLG